MHARRLLQGLAQWQLRLAALALSAMMLTTVADVFMRYAFNSPVRGSYDFVECMLVVFVFHGIAAVFFNRQNIVIDLIDPLVGKRGAAGLTRMADAISLGCLLLLAWTTSGPALQAFDYGDRKLELQLPLSVLWLVALTGMAGTILAALAALVSPVPATHPEHPE